MNVVYVQTSPVCHQQGPNVCLGIRFPHLLTRTPDLQVPGIPIVSSSYKSPQFSPVLELHLIVPTVFNSSPQLMSLRTNEPGSGILSEVYPFPYGNSCLQTPLSTL